jgi:hypothetical protein
MAEITHRGPRVRIRKNPRALTNKYVAYDEDGVFENNDDPGERIMQDDVTGLPIPPGAAVFQDGLLKDARPHIGSVEKEWRNAEKMGEATYETGSYGVQSQAFGEFTDEYE